MRLNKKGFAIGMVLIIVFILMMAGATFLFRMQGGVTSISVIEKSTKATYLAEAGINLASAYLRSYGICFESGLTLPERSLDGGTFNTAMSRKTPNSSLVTILSSGSYSGTSKVIMVQALCMPAPTTTPVILTQNYDPVKFLENYSPERFFIPGAAHAAAGINPDYPMQIVYFRVAEDDELEKLISSGGKKNTVKDMLSIMMPVIEGERRFNMENSASPAADKKHSNIFGQKIKVPSEPGSVETLITAGSKADKARDMAAIMEEIDEIVTASLYSKLWNGDSMTVELFRESFGDACDIYAACGNQIVKSGQPLSAISKHIIFSGLPGIQIASYNNAKNSIENLMPPVLVYDSVKPPDFNGQGRGAILKGLAANSAPVRRATSRDAEPIIKLDTAEQLEEKLADKIASSPTIANAVERHMKERDKDKGQNGEFREARRRRQEKNRGGGNNDGPGKNNGNAGDQPQNGKGDNSDGRGGDGKKGDHHGGKGDDDGKRGGPVRNGGGGRGD